MQRRLVVSIVFGSVLYFAAGAPADSPSPIDPMTDRLAGAIRLRTVSPQDPADFDPAPFLALHRFLETSFPRVHAELERETVSEYSLLYTWRGSDPSRAPILLTSHLDVVPILPGSEQRWTQPPFEGVIADGFIWGRGTLDNKSGVLATFEAVEMLLAEGFVPTRTVYLAFGHDEELGGSHGAAAITDLLASRDVHLQFTLDEGMAILEDLGGLSQSIAMVGVAEKGFLTLEARAHAPGGHSSVPPAESAIGRIARTITRLEENPMPAHLDGLTGEMLDVMAPQLPLVQRIAIEQRWLLGGLVERGLSSSPTTNAVIRTTTAVTILRAGAKSNVLPTDATATVNFRIHPSDTAASIVEHVHRIVDDPEVEIVVLRSSEASRVSSSSSEAFGLLRDAIREVNPGLLVAPALVLGGTDSKHYGRIADDSYRFAPLRIASSDAKRFHGIDERIGVAAYLEMPSFYAALLRRAAGSEAEAGK